MNFCGAKTKNGKKCQRRVEKRGKRCWQHESRTRNLANKAILVAEKLALVHATYGAVTDIYVKIDPILQQLSAWIMPEHFWFLGYQKRDQSEMDAEVKLAKEKVDDLDYRCSQYSDQELTQLELGYDKILEELAILENR